MELMLINYLKMLKFGFPDLYNLLLLLKLGKYRII
jgi:hypothetical protein